MSQVHGQPPAPRIGSDWTYCRAQTTDRHQALALLLTGHDHVDPTVVHQFLEFTDDHRLSVDHLWVARRNGHEQPVAAVMLIENPGRTSMIFLSPLSRREMITPMANLIRAACTAGDHREVRMVQALLDSGQLLHKQALLTSGFHELAQLMYMQRSGNPKRGSLTVDSSIMVTQWHEAHRKLFADAILASYEKTLDCPGLVGVREIDDVIAGHMASGQFNPDLWFALYQDAQPVAVMLLNPIHQRQALELVYLGVCPDWRGKGIGRQLVKYGLGLVDQYQASSMMLAVDSQNKPALKLYRSMGFVSGACKHAMFLTLDGPG